jgi:hypothetical protein
MAQPLAMAAAKTKHFVMVFIRLFPVGSGAAGFFS